MLELLAAIQEVEPTAWPLVAIMLSSVAMYAVGILLPCSSCCPPQYPCGQCEEGQLPDTVTVTLDGIAESTPQFGLCQLTAFSTFGGGAVGRLTGPGGVVGSDEGPITGVEVLAGGSGYAVLGRAAPTLTVTGSGQGATFTPTISQQNPSSHLTYWRLDSVAVSGGSGYTGGTTLGISPANGDTTATAAAAILITERAQPTVTATASGGSGAEFQVTLSKTTETSSPLGTQDVWQVASVSLIAGGTGYTNGQSLTFSAGTGGVTLSGASAYVTTGRAAPVLTPIVGTSTGSGASITPNLTQNAFWDGQKYWSISSFNIVSAGTGYQVGDEVFVIPSQGVSVGLSFSATVTQVDGSGGIIAIQVSSGGGWFRTSGTIESVTLNFGGRYYRETGTPKSVVVTQKGAYYKEDATLPAVVADITVVISCTEFGSVSGSGGVLSAVVDDDTESPTFGAVTAFTVDQAGDNYLAWRQKETPCCGSYYNGMTLVLRRGSPDYYPWASDPCTYYHYLCGVGNRNQRLGLITAQYRGQELVPLVTIISETPEQPYWASDGLYGLANSRICNMTLEADEPPANCSAFSFVASAGGATATVSAGGEYDDDYRNPLGWAGVTDGFGRLWPCHICCRGESMPPTEVVATVSGFSVWPPDGDYVLSRGLGQAVGYYNYNLNARLAWIFLGNGPDPTTPYFVEVDIAPCGGQNSGGQTKDNYIDNCSCGKCSGCFMVASVTPPNSYTTRIDQALGIGGCPADCSSCETSPQCAPYGRTFTLITHSAGNPTPINQGTVVIENQP